MSGVSVTITLDDADVIGALQRLDAATGSMRPFFEEVGAAMLRSTRERAAQEISADGIAWAPLSPRYKQRKEARRPGLKILRWEGHLLGDTLTFHASDNAVDIGSGAIYAAIHQLGGNAGRGHAARIPARPFLGLSDEDKDSVLFRANRYLQAALEG